LFKHLGALLLFLGVAEKQEQTFFFLAVGHKQEQKIKQKAAGANKKGHKQINRRLWAQPKKNKTKNRRFICCCCRGSATTRTGHILALGQK
jgi:hypothetical protein